MATWADVERLVAALPEVEVGTRWGNRTWLVKGNGFVWERPLSKKDQAALGDAYRDAPILAAHVEHLGEKEALLQQGVTSSRGRRPAGRNPFFTSPHFDGHASILVWLDEIEVDELEEVITDAWVVRAPQRLADAFLDSRPG